MLSILLSWIIIFIVFYSFGQMVLLLSSKLFNDNVLLSRNSYNCLDTLLIGMCALVLPLQLWSLFLPSNHVFLILCLVVSLIFLTLNRSVLTNEIQRLKNVLSSLSVLQLGILSFFVLLVFWSSIWLEGNFDSEFYHYQAIRWNEEYPVIPGLANLEDRLAFNSSFFLLSAIFSFRFLWGEAVYAIQLFFFVALVLWALVSMFRSSGGVNQLVVFIGVMLFSVLYVMQLVNTSTDILPNLIFFYLAVNIFLSVDDLFSKKILFFTLPFLLVTLKISLAPIGLISIYIYIILCEKREIKAANVLFIISSLVIVLWLVRNVILSGYLIYPIYELDFFTFDWKLPREIAILQKQYIYDYPISVWKETLDAPFMRISRPIWANLLAIGVVVLLCVSCVVLSIYVLTKLGKKKLDAALLVVGVSFLIIIVSVSNGFDLRFIAGTVVGMIVLGGVIFSRYLKLIQLKWMQYPLVALFFLTYGIWTGTFSRDRFSAVKEYSVDSDYKFLHRISLTPYPAHEYMAVMKYIKPDTTISLDKIDDKFDIYVSSIVFGMNHFPLTYRVGEAHHGTLVDYNCLKARGNTIQEGFRMDTVCMHQSLKLVKEALEAKGY